MVIRRRWWSIRVWNRFKDSEENDVEYTYDLNSGELLEKGDYRK